MRINIFDKILSHILKRYTEKIYKIGMIDYYNWNNKNFWQGCNKAVTIIEIKRKKKNKKRQKRTESKYEKHKTNNRI